MARVLLVEDDATYANLAGILLGMLGHEVIAATRGDEGLRLALEQLPHLVVMDSNLPGLDGLAVVRRLREEPATRLIPVLGLTADRVGEPDRDAALAAGFSAYSEKPTRLAAFRDLIEPLLV